jgi:hypothetical protein
MIYATIAYCFSNLAKNEQVSRVSKPSKPLSRGKKTKMGNPLNTMAAVSIVLRKATDFGGVFDCGSIK